MISTGSFNLWAAALAASIWLASIAAAIGNVIIARKGLIKKEAIFPKMGFVASMSCVLAEVWLWRAHAPLWIPTALFVVATVTVTVCWRLVYKAVSDCGNRP